MSKRWRIDGERRVWRLLFGLVLANFAAASLAGEVIFSTYSPYHHIEVVDENGVRTLSFNGSMETRMNTNAPLQGHFEYTEFFHMPWLWNTNVRRVLMIGLGGGSTQRSFQHYHTNVTVDTVELDQTVVYVAKHFFHVAESAQHKIHVSDGRVFLRRTTNVYDVIIMDAYATTRYGSSIPPHLTTREFFSLARSHLTTNGVLAYNIIGQIRGWNEEVVGALHRTLKEVFPQVYSFPAKESQNVVLVATCSTEPFDSIRVNWRGALLVRNGIVRLPTFSARLNSFRSAPPWAAARVPVLTDDRAAVDSLMR
jgi:spermidine synthase